MDPVTRAVAASNGTSPVVWSAGTGGITLLIAGYDNGISQGVSQQILGEPLS